MSTKNLKKVKVEKQKITNFKNFGQRSVIEIRNNHQSTPGVPSNLPVSQMHHPRLRYTDYSPEIAFFNKILSGLTVLQQAHEAQRHQETLL